MKFGWYIALMEIPLEIALGKISTPVVFCSGGGAAVLMSPHGPLAAQIPKFLSSGAFIGGLGMFINRGNDKA